MQEAPVGEGGVVRDKGGNDQTQRLPPLVSSAAEEPGFKQKLNTVSGGAEQELSEMQMPSGSQL